MIENAPAESRREALENILGRPIIKTLENSGITAESLALELKEELAAEKTEFFSNKGEVIETRNVIDWSTRQRARQDAHKLMGHYPPEKSGDTYTQLILQQNKIILSPVVQQIIDVHAKALRGFIKREDSIEVEVVEGK